jgi:hypothetical protein
MKRLLVALLAMVMTLALSSCDGLDKLLGKNLIAGEYELTTADLNGKSVAEIKDLTVSDSFFAAVRADPALKAAVLESTALVVTDTLAADTPAEKVAIQEAATLAVEVIIFGSSAGDLLKRSGAIVDKVMLYADSEMVPTINEILDAVLPPSILDTDGSINQDAFVELINAFLDAQFYLEALGNNIEGTALADPATSTGDLAMMAFVSAALTGIVPPPEFTDTYQGDNLLADYLFGVLTASGDVDPPDFVMPDLSEGSYLSNILGTANLTAFFDF